MAGFWLMPINADSSISLYLSFTDKQAASSTILALNEQITALNNKISAMEEFQKKVHDDMEHMQNREMKWKATEAKLIEELDEARVGSYQGN
jgi:hypothetical protein